MLSTVYKHCTTNPNIALTVPNNWIALLHKRKQTVKGSLYELIRAPDPNSPNSQVSLYTSDWTVIWSVIVRLDYSSVRH